MANHASEPRVPRPSSSIIAKTSLFAVDGAPTEMITIPRGHIKELFAALDWANYDAFMRETALEAQVDSWRTEANKMKDALVIRLLREELGEDE